VPGEVDPGDAGDLGAVQPHPASSGRSVDAAQLDLECDYQRELGYTDDYAEGVAAFSEKRAARFSGR
jgi:2-(1,2-epoxy-1,2-dihydrophenyl)acetyl-CoA isomerase